MALGFYVTDKGRDLIAQASTDESKVVINKLKIGDGANKNDPRDPSITELKNQVYEKEFDPALDRYFIDVDTPNIIEVICTLPGDAGDFMINEVGYYDTYDNLVIYGVLEETPKYAGGVGMAWTLDLHNIITFTNASDMDKIEFAIEMGSIGELEKQIKDVKRRVDEMTIYACDNTDIMEIVGESKLYPSA